MIIQGRLNAGYEKYFMVILAALPEELQRGISDGAGRDEAATLQAALHGKLK
jgi:hypothetical protein